MEVILQVVGHARAAVPVVHGEEGQLRVSLSSKAVLCDLGCMYVYSYPTTQYRILYDRAHNKGAQVVIVITINPSHVGLFTQYLPTSL